MEQKFYTVYFEIYGKKMKVRKQAVSQFDAESQVRKDIKVHKVEEESFMQTGERMFNEFFGDIIPPGK